MPWSSGAENNGLFLFSSVVQPVDQHVLESPSPYPWSHVPIYYLFRRLQMGPFRALWALIGPYRALIGPLWGPIWP